MTPRPAILLEATIESYRMLAVAVIRQAAIDARDPTLPDVRRRQARAFLAGGDGLRFWCDVLCLDSALITSRAATT
jgi:hypothetical protein